MNFVFEEPITVSEYISVLNQILSGVKAKVRGEVTGLKRAASGHIYFNLKDNKQESVINCAIWNSVYRMCAVNLEEGMEVIVSGSADVYPVRGTLTFKVATVQLAGEGALKKAYDKLKKKLSLEGVFDNNRPIPLYPHKIGLITSSHGAAVHDFNSNLGKFGFKIIFYDSRVEGQEAVSDLLSALKRIKKEDVELVVIIRGGGSRQSLVAFDNETLTREIANFPVPVVSGIGHHEDVTLAALASDVTESTPTAAASIISRGFEKAEEKVDRLETNIFDNYHLFLEEKDQLLKEKYYIVSSFFEKIISYYKEKEEKVLRNFALIYNSTYNAGRVIENQLKSVIYSFTDVLNKRKLSVSYFSDIIHSNNPQRNLRLGYSILYKDGNIQKSVKNLSKGDDLEISLYDGRVLSQVKTTKKHASKK